MMASDANAGSCCPPGSWGDLQDSSDVANQAGTALALHTGTSVYVTPANPTGTPPSRVVVMASDVFGIEGRRPRLADYIAHATQAQVLLVDFQRTQTAASAKNIKEYIKQFPWTAIEEDVNATFEHVKQVAASDAKIAAVGLCWGVWAAAQMSAQGYPLIAIAGPHPSLHVEGFAFGRDTLDLVKAIKCPTLLLPAGNDPPEFQEDGEASNYLREAFPNKSKVVAFPQMKHGWTARGDFAEPNVKEDTIKALQIITTWLNERFED